MLVAAEEPGGAGDELVIVADRVIAVRVLDEPVPALVLGALVEAREREALLVGPLLDHREQVVDDGVALRGDADAPARPQRRDHHAGGAEALAGAGRPLDRQDRAVEGEHRRAQRLECRTTGRRTS